MTAEIGAAIAAPIFSCYSIFEMAKIFPPDGGMPNQVAGGNLIVTLPTGTTTMQRQNNNRRNIGRATTVRAVNSSPGFNTLDSKVTNLDATYDMLAIKGDWDTYAANIIDQWVACVNCTLEPTGKKLYRQYNFNRSLIGTASVNTPVDNTEACQGEQLAVSYSSGPLPANNFLIIEEPQAPVDMWTCVQSGRGLSNPVFNWNSYSEGRYSNTDPAALFILGVVNDYIAQGYDPSFGSLNLTACTFTNNGAPGETINFDVLYSIA